MLCVEFALPDAVGWGSGGDDAGGGDGWGDGGGAEESPENKRRRT